MVEGVEDVKVNDDDVPLLGFVVFQFPVLGEEEDQVIPQFLDDGLDQDFLIVEDRLVDAELDLILAAFEPGIELGDDGVLAGVGFGVLFFLPQVDKLFLLVVGEAAGQLNFHFFKFLVNL